MVSASYNPINVLLMPAKSAAWILEILLEEISKYSSIGSGIAGTVMISLFESDLKS